MLSALMIMTSLRYKERSLLGAQMSMIKSVMSMNPKCGYAPIDCGRVQLNEITHQIRAFLEDFKFKNEGNVKHIGAIEKYAIHDVKISNGVAQISHLVMDPRLITSNPDAFLVSYVTNWDLGDKKGSQLKVPTMKYGASSTTESKRYLRLCLCKSKIKVVFFRDDHDYPISKPETLLAAIQPRFELVVSCNDGKIKATIRQTHNHSGGSASSSASKTTTTRTSKRTPPTTTPSNQTSTRSSAFLSDKRFSDASVKTVLSANTLQAVKQVYGYVRLSKIQAATMHDLLAGRDVFAKARTGAGKTMSFLIPAIEQAAKAPQSRNSQKGAGIVKIHCVVVSPTKELAIQTYDEAVKLLSFHKPLRAMVMIGGHSKSAEINELTKGGVIAILVATPGRIVDHIQTTSGFKDAMQHVRTVVLDEADRMLEDGFRRPLETILQSVQAQRQTVLVSATMPTSVLDISKRYMKPDMKVIDVTGGIDARPRINPQVRHGMLVVEPSMYPHAFVKVIQHRWSADPDRFKAIVFVPTVKMVAFLGGLFKSCMPPGIKLMQIHSDLSQSQRDRVTQEFRDAKCGVLMGTDVVGRGVDFKGVTFVLQVGITTKDAFVHRLGRTGRAGQPGEGLLLLSSFEEAGMDAELKEFHVTKVKQTVHRETCVDAAIANVDKDAGLLRLAEKAFKSFVGAYASNTKMLKLEKKDVLRYGRELFVALGLKHPPELGDKLLKKMGF